MRDKKVLVFFLLGLVVLIIAVSIMRYKSQLANPQVSQRQTVAGSTSDSLPEGGIKPPPQVKYDSLTDLNKQLDSIDPQVTDSDFDNLKQIIDSLK